MWILSQLKVTNQPVIPAAWDSVSLSTLPSKDTALNTQTHTQAYLNAHKNKQNTI